MCSGPERRARFFRHGPGPSARRRRRTCHSDHPPEGVVAGGVWGRRGWRGQDSTKSAWQAHLRMVLLDVSLPMGGVSLAGEAPQWRQRYAVVMMSGHATVDAAVARTRSSGDRLFWKNLCRPTGSFWSSKTRSGSFAPRKRAARSAGKGIAGELIGQSRAMVQLREQLAPPPRPMPAFSSPASAGRGKELVARAIHLASPRAKGPLEKITARPFPRAHRSAFGHERVPSPRHQATSRQVRAGRGGTIFSRRSGDMPLPMQAKLLRVLQEHEIEARRRQRDLQDRRRVSLPPTAISSRPPRPARSVSDLTIGLKRRSAGTPPLRTRRDAFVSS